MVSERSKIIKEDLILLGLIDEPEQPKVKKKKYKYIYLPIDRKYIGMTKKERSDALNVSKRN